MIRAGHRTWGFKGGIEHKRLCQCHHFSNQPRVGSNRRSSPAPKGIQNYPAAYAGHENIICSVSRDRKKSTSDLREDTIASHTQREPVDHLHPELQNIFSGRLAWPSIRTTTDLHHHPSDLMLRVEQTPKLTSKTHFFPVTIIDR